MKSAHPMTTVFPLSARRTFLWLAVLASMLLSNNALSGEADVIKAKITALGGDRYSIIATVKHGDKGWEHYANAWQVLNEKGEVIGERILHHPHVKEQPFSRSLTLNIPKTVRKVTIRAKDSVHGFGGRVVVVEVPL